MPHMTDSIDPANEKLRAEVAAQMAEWEARNGPIETLPCVERDNDMVRANNGQKCITINPAKMRARQAQRWKEGKAK